MALGTIEILGMKLRLEHLVLYSVALGALYMVTLYACKKVSVKEGFEMMSAAVSYDMVNNNGVWNSQEEVTHPWSPSKKDVANKESESKLVKPHEMMSFFNETTFSPECCPSAYSANGGLNTDGRVSGKGCACLNKEQSKYLAEHGGN